ncbi:hypothetical protein SSAG_04029 [Streptomyces sp. Mg1]|nr:hypothetical protein SSAG_04029 [Streptomyces sp. Mg1]
MRAPGPGRLGRRARFVLHVEYVEPARGSPRRRLPRALVPGEGVRTRDGRGADQGGEGRGDAQRPTPLGGPVRPVPRQLPARHRWPKASSPGGVALSCATGAAIHDTVTVFMAVGASAGAGSCGAMYGLTHSRSNCAGSAARPAPASCRAMPQAQRRGSPHCGQKGVLTELQSNVQEMQNEPSVGSER